MNWWLIVFLVFFLVLIYFQYRSKQPEYELANVEDEDADLDEYELESNESDEFRIQI